MRFKNKPFFVIFIVLVIGGLAYLLFFDSEDKNRKGEVGVEVVAAQTQPIYDSVEALGTAQANESVTITANVTDVISEIHFADGQQVAQGDVIARMQQQEEQAQLQAARVQLAEHKRELARLGDLLKNRAASKREYDERQTQLALTEQTIKELEARINDRTLRAPFAGTLGVRRLSTGALVQPGDIITTLDDLSSIKLDFSVPEIYLNSLKTRVPIEAHSIAIPGKVFTGEIDAVNTRIDPVARSILVRAVLPNPDNLMKPGLLMQVTLLKGERSAIVVPEEAVVQRQTDHYLYVVGADNKVSERKVEIGVRNPGIVEIVKGLDAGEKVVVRGVMVVKPGQTASIAKEWEGLRPPLLEAAPAEAEAQ